MMPSGSGKAELMLYGYIFSLEKFKLVVKISHFDLMGIWGLGIGVWDLGLGVWDLGSGAGGLRSGVGDRVWDLRSGIWGSDLGSGIWGLGLESGFWFGRIWRRHCYHI